MSDPHARPMNYLITGAARGIGRSLTRSLIARGHRVFLLDNNAEELDNTLTLLSKHVPGSTSSASSTQSQSQSQSAPVTKEPFAHALCDLGDRHAIKAAVHSAATFFDGRLDVLINNAMALPHTWQIAGADESSAGSGGGGMEDGTNDEILAQWDAKIAIGLTAPFLLTRLCVPLLRAAAGAAPAGAAPGCVINISSSRALQSEPDGEGYSAAKAGLLGLTQSAAVSLGGRYGIRVNAILPGWINVADECREADELGSGWEDGLTRADHDWHPAGRVGRGEDVLKAVLFLVESGFVTGQEILVDGGVGRKMVYPE